MSKNKEICFLCGNVKSEGIKFAKGKYGCVCEDCIQEVHDMLNNMETETISCDSLSATPSQIKAHLDQYVIGQEEAKKTLAVAVYNHYKRLRQSEKSQVEIQKSNILIIGGTGSGKTYLAQTIAKFIGVPFAIADATTLTQAGYVGEEVESILCRLLENVEFDSQLAEQGIVYIDEIDKIARKGENMSITRDVAGEGVQQSLLKILEGSVVRVPLSGGRKHPQAECVEIDTSNILFICGGAFDGLQKIINRRNDSKTIGFGADIKRGDESHTLDLSDVQQKDITTFGIIPELIGRLPVICTLNPLSKEDLKSILVQPKNAIIKQYQELFKMDGVELDLTEDALDRIVDKAIERKTGARGLRSIIENVMRDLMYNLPDQTDITKITITGDYIDGKADAMIYRTKKNKTA